MDGLFKTWMEASPIDEAFGNLTILAEKNGSRAVVIGSICDAVCDHFVGLSVIEMMGGYPRSISVIKNRLPTGKKIRSGDLGEILASEYIAEALGYSVPVKRLRYKDDRELSMRGDDVIAFKRVSGRLHVLKVEAKSRINLSDGVVSGASAALMKHSGRPNPSSLAFISLRLRDQNKHNEAAEVETLQSQDIPLSDVTHLIFTFSGNDPTDLLKNHCASPDASLARLLVGASVKDHAGFVRLVFEEVDARGN